MSNNQWSDWSDWIEWSGGECPLDNGTEYTVKLRGGYPMDVEDKPEDLDWHNSGGSGDIIAYRYRLVDTVKKPKTTLEFGDTVHILGEKYIFISEEGGHIQSVDERGQVKVCPKEVFDEFKPNPKQERRKALMEVWRKQDLEFAHDTEASDINWVAGDVITFIEENKDEIIAALTK